MSDTTVNVTAIVGNGTQCRGVTFSISEECVGLLVGIIKDTIYDIQGWKPDTIICGGATVAEAIAELRYIVRSFTESPVNKRTMDDAYNETRK